MSARPSLAETKPEGWRSLLHGGNAVRFTVVTGGVALHAVSIYVVATIMPTVVHDLGGLAFFAWTTTLYIAGSLTGSAGVPLMVARLGPRVSYRAAFLLFLSGSLICSLAPSFAVLLLGRVLQGLGGGMLPALAYATIRSLFAPHLHARAIALLGSVWGIAALLGPSVGGVFAEFGVWRSAFWVDVLIGLSFLLMAERTLPGRDPADATAPARAFPGLRLALLAAAAMAVSLGGSTQHWSASAAGVAVAIVLVALMLRADARAPSRLVPADAFRPSRRMGAVSATMGLVILSSSPCAFVPYLLQSGFGQPPIAGGYISAFMALSWTGVSLVTAGMGRTGARRCTAFGPILICLGVAANAWALAGDVMGGIALGQVLIGAGIGVGWAHLGALLMAVAGPAERDIAGPFITTTQTLAAVFGSALSGMVANLAGLAEASAPAGVRASGFWLFAVLAIIPVAGTLVSWQALRLTRSA